MLVNIQSHLLYVRVRFDQPDYSRPRAGGSIRALRVWNDFVGHRRIMDEGKPAISAAIAICSAFLANSPGELGPSPHSGKASIPVGHYPDNQALTLRA